MERNREKQMIDLHTGTPWETVTLTAIGRNKQLFFDILNQCKLKSGKYNETSECDLCSIAQLVCMSFILAIALLQVLGWESETFTLVGIKVFFFD